MAQAVWIAVGKLALLLAAVLDGSRAAVSVSCGMPVISNTSGVAIVGGGNATFARGATVQFNCSRVGFHAIPASATCQANGTWDYNTVPYCAAVRCPDLYHYYGLNNNYLIPYGKVVLLNEGANDTAKKPSQTSHTYGAKIEFQCDIYTAASGPAVLTCLSSGQWSSPPPICTVPNSYCINSTTCPTAAGHPDFTSCCTYGSQQRGPMCCPKTTKLVLDARFTGLSARCQADLTAAFGLCAGQIVDCFNQRGLEGCDGLVARFYRHGCNSGVPAPPSPTPINDGLKSFCRLYGFNQSLACSETVLQVTKEDYARDEGVCLPASCTSDSGALQAVAKASLQTYCAAENNPYFCSSAAVALSCQNGVSAQATQTASCAKCPAAASECCAVANFTLGCCSKSVKKLVAERFSNISSACTAAMYGQLEMCGIAIVSCLNKIESSRSMYDCPNIHTCMDWKGSEVCTDPRTSTTVYCSSSCSGTHSCESDKYCMSPECMNQGDVTAMTAQDATIACDLYKLVTGNASCGEVTVSTQCHASDGRNFSASYHLIDKGTQTTSTYPTSRPTGKPSKKSSNSGIIIGISVAVVLLLIGMVAYIIYRKRKLRAQSQRYVALTSQGNTYTDEDQEE